MAKEKVVRLTADIPPEDAQRLEELASSMKSNKTTALVQALRTSSYLDEIISKGSRIEVVDKDGTRREIIVKGRS